MKQNDLGKSLDPTAQQAGKAGQWAEEAGNEADSE